MGTTLTGTTPQDTYDSLIKVTDNGPIGATAKYLSDGLGNDSVLALSTSAVGVGTTTMARKFNIDGGSITSDTPTLRISSTDGSGTRKFGIEFYSNSGADVRGKLLADNSGKVYLDDNGGGGVVLQANGGTGNVGIGTSSPTGKLQVKGAIHIERASTTDFSVIDNDGNLNIKAATGGVGGNFNITFQTGGLERARITANGLTFNGDTLQVNALDDYEEGTFTPTFTPSSGAYGTLTYGTTNGKYTKIGNRVDFSLRVTITAYSAGSASGNLQVANLPFACVASYVGSVSMSLVDDFAANRYPIKGFVNDTTNYILLRYMTALNTNEVYVGATDITASSTIRISGTYFTA